MKSEENIPPKDIELSSKMDVVTIDYLNKRVLIEASQVHFSNLIYT